MPKPGERMSAAQRQKIRNAMKARAAKKNEPAANPAAPAEPIIEPVAGLEAEIISPAGPAGQSLLDRVKAGFKKGQQAGGEGQKKGNEEKSEDLLLMLLPVASGFLAYNVKKLWSEEYQACAPTKAEVAAILRPLLRIVSRSLEIHFTETPLIRDLRMSASALLSYVFRAAISHIEISERIERERAVEHAERHIKANAARNGYQYTGREDYQGAGSRTSGISGSISQAAVATGGIYTLQSEPTDNAPETDAEYARRVIAEARMQDLNYRTQHGML